MALWKIDPWGEQRADLRNALLCTVMVNMWKGEKGRDAKVTDFMLFADDKPRGQDPTREQAIGWAKALQSLCRPKDTK